MIVISITVYINFLPIARLVRSLNVQKKPVSEVDMISNALSDYEQETEHLQDSMNDGIIRRLIEGHAVTDEMLKNLEIQSDDRYCVLAIAGLSAQDELDGQFTQQAQETCAWRILVTTLDFESYILLLCVQNDSAAQSEIHEHRRRLAQGIWTLMSPDDADAVSLRIGVGTVVDRPEDIHRSYLGALTAIESGSTSKVIYYEKNMDLGFGELVQDYTKIMMNLFKHMQQGDRSYAQMTLRELFDYVQLNAPSVLLQRHFCYDIINTYLKHLQSNNYEIDHKVRDAILHGDSLAVLYQDMLKSVEAYCGWMEIQQKKQQNDNARQIADYVNARFTDPALSLDMIADHFNISIYMVSRILKAHWKCGYKEYLTARRIEFSKKLIENESLSTAEIAAKAGFSDAIHFSRAFRANTGISPVQYRKIMVTDSSTSNGSS